MVFVLKRRDKETLWGSQSNYTTSHTDICKVVGGIMTELLHGHTFLPSMPFLWRWFELLSKIGEVSVFMLCGGATFTLYGLFICCYYHSMPRAIYVCLVFKVGLCFKHSISYTIFYLTHLALIMDYAWETILTQSPHEH